ncbi:unnamed protein product, partial [Brassica oleracea var. botrytis]
MASSSSLSRGWLYHVFVSFRGVDVRKGFLSHVLKGLESKGIITFIDDEMKRGQSIDAALLGAIRQSRVAVVLLSRNYASSSWCLDELVEIMKCREEYQQTVMTIFYEVDPSHVRKQTGDFGKAFDETCVGKTEEVKQSWRKALEDVAGIAGYDFSNCDNEADLVNKVASNVTAVLGFTPSKDFDNFVGIRARIIEIKSKLILQSEEVKVIGIVGPAGIGKTSTARVLYNQLSPGFPFNTFLENIRESYEKPCGNDYQLKLRLHKNLLSQILNQTNIEVHHLGVAREMLSDKKVLVVFDEVDSWWQLEEMANQRGWVGPGSIIIITTEDRKLLNTLGLGIDHIYGMKFPTTTESLQIFCQSAFGQKSPKKGFEMLAWEVTGLAGNLPLGLRVMGSYLRGMSMDYWINALPRLRSSLDKEIGPTLRFSYDGLSDNDKVIFLHIACFFTCSYFEVYRVKRCLANCDLQVEHGLQVLADKSLISIDNIYVWMHSLLQQMGREIVKKQSLEERQFLIDAKEISDVLKNNTGTGNILGITSYHLKRENIQINKSAFDGMHKLQFLEVAPGTLSTPDGLNCLPDNLRLIHWNECPLEFWPSKFSGKYLVELIMQRSNFKKLWDGRKPLQCLKLMDLSESECLEEIPDLSNATSLKKLHLSKCERLLEITTSIGKATSLEELDLTDCPSLKKISGSSSLIQLDMSNTEVKEMPSSISTWSCLYRLDITGCKHIKDFPNVSDSIVVLVLSDTGIKEVPPWIKNLSRLRILDMYGCKKLKKISPNISKLENLEFLALSFCDFSEYNNEGIDMSNDAYLFEAIVEWGPDFRPPWRLRSDFNVRYILPRCLPDKALTSPISLRFGGNGLKTIPDCIRSLSKLSKLDISYCENLVALPQLPGSLLCIDAHGCESLKRIYSSFQNPKICLNFASCFNLNKKARKLIQTPVCEYALLPGEEVPAHFTHQASLCRLPINLTPRPLPSSFRFQACIVLSTWDSSAFYLMKTEVSCLVRGEQNGLTVRYRPNKLHHIQDLYGFSKHLYIFEGSFSLNKDCPAAEDITFSKLTFVFRVHDKTVRIKSCGVRFLEIPHCIINGNADED